ncbi:hypothetical protein [Gimesia chilikensis]|uniref:hypothetical protein n=1 Tax=Gimesia chilikensis TaxID=2605989 RepID=UPI001188FC49|nr:hypothetical protein [Gimesia chilikensis]QDT84605.1 hypothetical protein MalM14_22650 [Gimesia chilikensis]
MSIEVATMNEGRIVARQKYAEYMKAVKERHSAEYEALKNGYRELSKGRQVIDLAETMKNAGVDHLDRPRLAIVRADAKLCWFRWTHLKNQWGQGNSPIFSAGDDMYPLKSKSVVIPRGVFSYNHEHRNRNLRAVVPSIPPSLLPAGKLSNYHILWEAEWETIPVDPMLLKYLGKNLYVVLAQWDLTPLERAVLRDAQ